MDRHLLLRRLVEVRLLLELASEIQDRPEPANNFALLQYHDAVELLLCIGAERLNITPPHELDKYWQLLEKADVHLGRWQPSVKQLCRARNSYKHHGMAPSPQVLTECGQIARSFVENATKTLTGIPFAEVRLSLLVQCLPSRHRLDAAETRAARRQWQKSAKHFALSLANLLEAFEENQAMSARSPYFFGEDMTALNARTLNLDPAVDPTASAEIREPISHFVDAVGSTLRKIQRALNVIAMGINYPQYVRFNRLTPKVRMNEAGRFEVRANTPSSFCYTDAEIGFLGRFIVDDNVPILSQIGAGST